MNSVIEELLENVKADPLPSQHTSSHWAQYGQEIVAEKTTDGLRLQASGFEYPSSLPIFDQILHYIERLTYHRTTSRWSCYSDVWQLAVAVAHDLHVSPDFNVFKSTAIVSILTEHCRRQKHFPKNLVIIGDGAGFLGALIRKQWPTLNLFCVDLPPMLVFQCHTHQIVHPQTPVGVLKSRHLSSGPSTFFVSPADIEAIPNQVDAVINVASMQEMMPSSVNDYFAFIRSRSGPQSWFYCLNRIEKKLPGGEISKFSNYPWHPQDKFFIDELCPFYHHYFSRTTLSHGPRMAGLRIPFINFYDGDHQHRLAHLVSRTKN